MVEAWPTAFFVAALVGIVHSHFHWLDGVDGYVFGVVSTFHQNFEPVDHGQVVARDTKPRVRLFSIDESRFETRYFGRTPLDRCQLADDLESVYRRLHRHNAAVVAGGADNAGKLDALVIDLDLSPVLSRGDGHPLTASETACQRKLDDVLRHQAESDAPADDRIRTITLTPFDADTNVASLHWQDRMQDVVAFGDPNLRVEHGMASRYACDPQSLAAVAYRASRPDPDGCIERALDDGHGEEVRYEPIDPRTYLEQIDVVEWADVDDTPRAGRAADDGDPRVKAAFFGVAFGADQFLTPIGKLSGVEVHAGSFLSLLDPVKAWSDFLAFVIDVVIGLVFGLCIRFAWERYFHASLHGSETCRTFAAAWLVVLAFFFIAVSFALIYASAYLFHLHVWLSPLPMAIGMLFEGMVVAPVDHALESSGHPASRSFFHSVADRFGHDACVTWMRGARLAASGKFAFIAIWWIVILWSLLFE